MPQSRDAAYTISARQLSWQVGEAATTKSVTIELGYGIKLAGARAMLGHNATVQSLGNGSYRIDVTPRSTAKPVNFPVLLDFDQDVPGAAPLITCVIGAN